MKFIKESSTKILVIVFFVTGLVGLFPVNGLTCPIPVFRYALEYWDTDLYHLEVLYKNTLTAENEALINDLQIMSSEGQMKANLDVKRTDIEEKIDPSISHYLRTRADTDFPLMVLQYPRVSGINEVIWSGPLNQTNIDLLLHSPTRENIGNKLVNNITTVWIFLESGDKKKDKIALDRLERELERLEQTLVLRDPELWWGNSQDIKENNIPGIKFDIVRLSRQDTLEKRLVEMLLNCEDDLKKFGSEPIVFPVYGRGIVLYGIVGKGINEWNIREAAEFVTGDCSCQAKVANPGVDLLISIDWDKHVENLTDINIANPLSGIGDFRSKEKEARRLLESATLKRLGKSGDSVDNLMTDSSKVVYLDIPKENINPDGNEPKSGSGNKSGANSIENEDDEVVEVSGYYNSGEESKEMSENRNQKKGGLDRLVMMVLAGMLFLVLVGGIVIYKNASK